VKLTRRALSTVCEARHYLGVLVTSEGGTDHHLRGHPRSRRRRGTLYRRTRC